MGERGPKQSLDPWLRLHGGLRLDHVWLDAGTREQLRSAHPPLASYPGVCPDCCMITHFLIASMGVASDLSRFVGYNPPVARRCQSFGRFDHAWARLSYPLRSPFYPRTFRIGCPTKQSPGCSPRDAGACIRGHHRADPATALFGLPRSGEAQGRIAAGYSRSVAARWTDGPVIRASQVKADGLPIVISGPTLSGPM
jgi:hypothetical protein